MEKLPVTFFEINIWEMNLIKVLTLTLPLEESEEEKMNEILAEKENK